MRPRRYAPAESGEDAAARDTKTLPCGSIVQIAPARLKLAQGNPTFHPRACNQCAKERVGPPPHRRQSVQNFAKLALTAKASPEYHIPPIFSSGRHHGDGGFFPFSRAINCCWFGFKWSVVLAVVAGAVAVFCFYRRVDEEIRRRVEARIAQHYPRLEGQHPLRRVGGGKGHPGSRSLDRRARRRGTARGDAARRGGAVRVSDGLEGTDPGQSAGAAGDGPPARRCASRVGPTARWSAAKLLPPPQFGDRPPEVTVESGVIEIFDPLKSPASTLTLRDVNLSLVPVPLAATGRQTGHATVARECWPATVSAAWSRGLGRSPGGHLLDPRPGGRGGDFARTARFACPTRWRRSSGVGRFARAGRPAIRVELRSGRRGRR